MDPDDDEFLGRGDYLDIGLDFDFCAVLTDAIGWPSASRGGRLRLLRRDVVVP